MEDEWVITKKFSVTDFDEEGNNLYIDDRGLFYVDKIDMANNELIIKRFNKEKALVDIIRTRIFYEKTSSNTYLRRNEMLAFFFDDPSLYLYYPGRKYTGPFDDLWKIDTMSKIKTKVANLSLRGYVKYSIFGSLKAFLFYNDKPATFGDWTYQMKLIVREDNFLLYGYYRSGGEEGTDFEDYALFDTNGQVKFTERLKTMK